MKTDNGNAAAYRATVHLSLQGKGGVGKSLIASFLAQYFLSRNVAVKCIDTDPVNHTLAQYESLPVERLRLLNDGGGIDSSGFDSLMEILLTTEGTFVIDNGAATFIPLWNYILENDVVNTLRRADIRLLVHSVVTGGHAMDDTLEGFRRVADTTDDTNIIVWVNEYFGPVRWGDKTFFDLPVFADYKRKVLGSIAMLKQNQDTFGRDLERMICQKQTFEEAIESSNTFIMAKQRLKMVQRALFEQLDTLSLI